MKELTTKKYLCVIRGTEDFITNESIQYRGYYLLASDKLASIRAALEDYSIATACIFTRGDKLASHAVSKNEAGDTVLLRTWRGSIFGTVPPASMWISDTHDGGFIALLLDAKKHVKRELAHVEDV